MMEVILIKEGRRRWGVGQGNNDVEEVDDQGAQDFCLNATNARAKEAAR
jgi:hypothetical protein